MVLRTFYDVYELSSWAGHFLVLIDKKTKLLRAGCIRSPYLKERS